MNGSCEAGLRVATEMVDHKVVGMLRASVGSDAFGAKLGELALEFAFAKVWARPDLGRRERSLVTLGILIALRQTEELKIHALAAIRNGCTVREIEEALYQASIYAGFPAAASAWGAIATTLREGGHIK